jgi:hypothetical protein
LKYIIFIDTDNDEGDSVESKGIDNHLNYMFFITYLNVSNLFYLILLNSCSFIMFLQSGDEEGLKDKEGIHNNLINF